MKNIVVNYNTAIKKELSTAYEPMKTYYAKLSKEKKTENKKRCSKKMCRRK
jgi:hypothetical protein